MGYWVELNELMGIRVWVNGFGFGFVGLLKWAWA